MTTEAPIRTNRYGGNCRTCGGWVEANAGRIEKQGSTWHVYHLTDEACEAAKDAPAPTMPNRHEGGCTRCGDAVAPGEGTLTKGEYRWGELVHNAPCEDRGAIERIHAGDYANQVDPWPETFEQDGIWYHVTWERWSKRQCYSTDEWYDAVHQVARIATDEEAAPAIAAKAAAAERAAEHAHQRARERARDAQVPDEATAAALKWWREELANRTPDERGGPGGRDVDHRGGGRTLSAADLLDRESTCKIHIESPDVPDRAIFYYGWHNDDFVAITAGVPWTPEREAMAELVHQWLRRPLPDIPRDPAA